MGSYVQADNPDIEKLFVLADGSLDQVVDAMRAVSMLEVRRRRCGFLWLKKKVQMKCVANLEDVVRYLTKNNAA